MKPRSYWTWLVPALLVVAAAVLEADGWAALGIGLAAGLSLAGSV